MAQGRYAVPVPIPNETELAELATDVNTLGRGLAETEARRVRLLGEVAHEMRTPLTVIDGYVEAMIDGVMPATAAELGRVSEEVRRLRRLSDDLSSLSRAEEGRLGLVVRDVDLCGVTGAAAERLRPQAEDAGLHLVVDTRAEGVIVAADADRVAQVVTNLLGNAIRATPPGGEVSVGCRAEQGVGVVEVADTGEGLDGADLERVFERFYRVPGRRAVEGDTGSGIGLTVARGIMRAHGGDLTARSEGRGRGATFTARMPLGGLPGRGR
jgi:histidine kinase